MEILDGRRLVGRAVSQPPESSPAGGRVCFAGEEELGVISETVDVHVDFLKDMSKEACWG